MFSGLFLPVYSLDALQIERIERIERIRTWGQEEDMGTGSCHFMSTGSIVKTMNWGLRRAQKGEIRAILVGTLPNREGALVLCSRLYCPGATGGQVPVTLSLHPLQTLQHSSTD